MLTTANPGAGLFSPNRQRQLGGEVGRVSGFSWPSLEDDYHQKHGFLGGNYLKLGNFPSLEPLKTIGVAPVMADPS